MVRGLTPKWPVADSNWRWNPESSHESYIRPQSGGGWGGYILQSSCRVTDIGSCPWHHKYGILKMSYLLFHTENVGS